MENVLSMAARPEPFPNSEPENGTQDSSLASKRLSWITLQDTDEDEAGFIRSSN